MLLHFVFILWIDYEHYHHADSIQIQCQEQTVWNVVHSTQQELVIVNHANGCKWSSQHFCASLDGTCLRQMDYLKNSKGKERAWVTPEKMKHPLETAGLLSSNGLHCHRRLDCASIQPNCLWHGTVSGKETQALGLPSLPLSPFLALRHLSCPSPFILQVNSPENLRSS